MLCPNLATQGQVIWEGSMRKKISAKTKLLQGRYKYLAITLQREYADFDDGLLKKGYTV
jgi:hypothetical protein